MWPFKRSEISYYRIKKLGTKYYVERKLPKDFRWTTLHYYPSLRDYRWYSFEESGYKWEGNSLKEARDKISEFIPEYFEPFADYRY